MQSNAAQTAPRLGRPRLTTRDSLEMVGVELFSEQGFAATSVEEIANRAGISRRSFFRYFPTKADVVWGDFEGEVARLRNNLEQIPDDVPIMQALRHAVVAFNRVPRELVRRHRARLMLILSEPDLIAVSTLKFAEWRHAVAEFIARRSGADPTDHVPQLVGELALATSISAYRQWFTNESASLLPLIDESFARLASVDVSVAGATKGSEAGE